MKTMWCGKMPRARLSIRTESLAVNGRAWRKASQCHLLEPCGGAVVNRSRPALTAAPGRGTSVSSTLRPSSQETRGRRPMRAYRLLSVLKVDKAQ